MGFETIRKYFLNAAEGGNLSHAYLFYGPESIGKKMFAEEFAQTLNGGNNVDLKIVQVKEEEESILIDQIKELKHFFSLKPHTGPWKISIVNDAHKLTREAQNAFLKLLEEPSGDSLIILVTSKPASLFEVIRSRCQKIQFPPFTPQSIEEHLLSLGVDKIDSQFIAHIANGSIGFAIGLSNKEKLNAVQKSIASFDKLSSATLKDRFSYAKKVSEQDDLEDTVYYWTNNLRKSILKNRNILRRALKLSHTIQNSSYNKRIAIENFFIHV